MTPDKTPTDAELWQLHMQLPGQHKDPIDFARAVLAKWGSPVVAGEPVAWRHRMGPTDHWVDCSKEFHDWVLRKLKTWPGDEVQALCLATPQPTQAQAGAVPLTPSQYNIALGCATDIPPSRYEAVTRAIERAHGIKEGGQHG